MRGAHGIALLIGFAISSASFAQDAADPSRVFVVIDQAPRPKGKATFANMPKQLMDAITTERPILERPLFGNYKPVNGDSAKTMHADAIKAKAGHMLHVSIIDSVKDSAKKTTLTADCTLYEPKKDADPEKPMQYWQKFPTEKLKTVSPEIDPDGLLGKALGGKFPFDPYQLMALDLQAALVKRSAVAKGIEGKVDKNTLTVTVTVQNASKSSIQGLVLALPHEGFAKFSHVKADLEPGETKKVAFTFKDEAANKLLWKNGKLSEVYLDRGAEKK